MDIIDLKRKHEKAYITGQGTRRDAADDMVFYRKTQWDDFLTGDSQLGYKGQFDVLRKAGRQILADLSRLPVGVDLVAKEGTSPELADVAEGLYRMDDNDNRSLESYDNAKSETVICGVGAWELRPEYKSNRIDDNLQVIRRYPIFEANNTVFWDPDSKLRDKSDAMYVSVLKAFTVEGYKELVNNLTGEKIDTVDLSSFSFPEQSYTFPWLSGEGAKIYIVDFYYRKKISDTIVTLTDPLGSVKNIREKELPELMESLVEEGYDITGEKKIDRWRVTKYIASGEKILDSSIIAGENIPIVPLYGEYGYIEGEPYYEGITRLAKDPQRLRNFQLSYLAELLATGPRGKPIFYPEQVSGFEHMYEQSGMENKYPYLLVNSKDKQGAPLPLGPIAQLPDVTIPTALTESINLSRQAIEDVANPGLPQDIADPDLSGKAVLALQSRLDMQALVFQTGFKHAKRRDAEIYLSMLPEVYDVSRQVTVESPDGLRRDIQLMETAVDPNNGDTLYKNDLRGVEFDVITKIGPSYSTQKEQTLDRINEMTMNMSPEDPLRRALLLTELTLLDGADFKTMREYAVDQLVLSGVKKPSTDEEKSMLEQQAQRAGQDDANMVLAKAEQLKGQADILEERRAGIEMQLDDENDKNKLRIDSYRAATERYRAEVEAKKAGAEIAKKGAEIITMGINTKQQNKGEVKDGGENLGDKN